MENQSNQEQKEEGKGKELQKRNDTLMFGCIVPKDDEADTTENAEAEGIENAEIAENTGNAEGAATDVQITENNNENAE